MESPFPAPGKTIKVKTFLPGAGNEVGFLLPLLADYGLALEQGLPGQVCGLWEVQSTAPSLLTMLVHLTDRG